MAGFGFNTVSWILILVSFVFLLLATISTPVVTAFSLGSTSNYDYGVFGYCSTHKSTCPGATYPYSLGDLDTKEDWFLASDTRNKLAYTLIIAPIALGINFLTLILITLTHFFSSGLVIVTIIVNFVSFVATALIGVFAVLLFYPNVSWTAWILIGAAAANLISFVFLFLALKLNGDRKYDETDVESVNELTNFENKYADNSRGFNSGGYNGGFIAPAKKFNDYEDSHSSTSKDYEFKATPHQPPISNTLTNSSVYNSSPQLVKDFTQHNNNSFGSRTIGSATSHYEDAVNIVDGPNTPISSKQQIAPSFVPKVATPTMNDLPQSSLPYPPSGGLHKPAYNATDSVFEHHPVVEGHRPFTELDDDVLQHQNRGSQGSEELGSDASSDFTSVSQRAINPRYQQQPHYNDNYFQPQGNYQPQYPQQQPFQPQFQQQMPPPPPQHQYQPKQQFYGAPPVQQRFAVPRPQATASDNALANNPDFALGGFGGGPRKKPGFSKPNMGASRMGIPPGAGSRGPYGM